MSSNDGDPVVEEVLRFEALPIGSAGSRRAIVRWSAGTESAAVTFYADEVLFCEGDHGNSRLMSPWAEMHRAAGRSARRGAHKRSRAARRACRAGYTADPRAGRYVRPSKEVSTTGRSQACRSDRPPARCGDDRGVAEQPWSSAGSKTDAILQMSAFRAFRITHRFACRVSLPHRGSGAAAHAGALAITDEAAATGAGSPWPLGHPERARLFGYCGAQVRAVASASRHTPGMVSERYAHTPMSPGEPPSARHTLKLRRRRVRCRVEPPAAAGAASGFRSGNERADAATAERTRRDANKPVRGGVRS